MTNYDWIVVGGGIAGSALAYELAKQRFAVLLLDRAPNSPAATRYSYGGLAYWAGTTPLTQQLAAEGIALYRNLSAELGADIEFRELDLLLTVLPEADPQAVAADYAKAAIAPTVLDRQQACECEPQLNPDAISGALRFPHAHLCAQKAAEAYQAALQRSGGRLAWEAVLRLVRRGEAIAGVETARGQYGAAQVAIAAGGLSRALLQTAGLRLPLYFTHAEILHVPPVDWSLRALVMPAQLDRLAMEQAAARSPAAWDTPGQEPAPPILDPGAIQFRDRSLHVGQISRVLTDPTAPIDAAASEAQLRAAATHLFPALHGVPARWRRCLVGFSGSPTPAVGAIPGLPGAHLFAGFPNPLIHTAPLARHLAAQAAGQEDAVMAQVAIPDSRP